MFTVVVATLAVNIAANVVSPANDFANVFPKRHQFSPRRPPHRRSRHRDDAVAPPGRSLRLHLQLAARIFGRTGLDRRRADRGLLAHQKPATSSWRICISRTASIATATAGIGTRSPRRSSGCALAWGGLVDPGAQAAVLVCVVRRIHCGRSGVLRSRSSAARRPLNAALSTSTRELGFHAPLGQSRSHSSHARLLAPTKRSRPFAKRTSRSTSS